MKLFRLLHTLGNTPLRHLVGFATVSALSTTAVLAVITKAATKINETRQEFVDLPVAGLFIAAILLYIFAESRMIARLAADIEAATDRLRMRLIERLRHADLWRLEHFGRSRLFANITQNCKTISANSQYLAQTMRSIVLIVTILLYIAAISMAAFLLLAILLGIAAVTYWRLGQSLVPHQEKLTDHEAGLFECVADLFDGFKEQRLSSARSRAIGETFRQMSSDMVAARNTVHLHSWQQFVFGETTFNIMLGLVVFVVPVYSPSVSAELVKIAAAVLFLMTPVFGLMQSIAMLRDAEAAAGRMMALEGELAELEEHGSTWPQDSVPIDFAGIDMKGVQFSYPAATGEKPFTLGPLDMSVKRGEVIFVTGGNGSGKSTFIKLLTGLYHATEGQLLINGGLNIVASRLAAYRALIAPVFADFHLFSKFYGLAEFDRGYAEELMQWVEMTSVVGLREDRFERIDLSTGQRKRLALVAALLEKKPILVLDEWAADQDPHLRRKFYREFLPELRRRGLTVIAVTHDDHYFDAADRCLHLEEGRLTGRPAAEGGAA